jgi:hypothetical protein
LISSSLLLALGGFHELLLLLLACLHIGFEHFLVSRHGLGKNGFEVGKSGDDVCCVGTA